MQVVFSLPPDEAVRWGSIGTVVSAPTRPAASPHRRCWHHLRSGDPAAGQTGSARSAHDERMHEGEQWRRGVRARTSSRLELVQLLTPEGVRVDHPDYAFAGDDEQIKGFYRDMVMTRRIDSEATALQRQGELGLWASCLGQEAAQIGSGRAMSGQDVVFPTYREHGVAWCLGVDPLELLGLFRGVDLGGWDSAATRLPPLHDRDRRAGAARHRLRDGHRARRLGRHRRPGPGRGGDRLFRRRRDQPGRRQRGVHLRQLLQRADRLLLPEQPVGDLRADRAAVPDPALPRAAGFGFPGVRVDGNDVLAVHAVTSEALERARSGNGPTFIEAYTYRMGAHTTSDDPTKYRLADELEHWRLKDPIERVRAYLTRHGAADDAFFADVDAEADELAGTLRKRVPGLPDPDLVELFDNVYAEQTPHLVEQQAAYADYLGTFEPSVPSCRRAALMSKLTMAKALNAGLRRALEADPKVVLAGEDIGKLGGVFRVTEGLQKDFGEHRVIDSPLAESGIIGTAVGMALRGYRPVCEIQFDGFVYPGLRPDRQPGRQDPLPVARPAADADRDQDPVRRRDRGGRAPQRVA